MNIQTSRQAKQRLLCFECEQAFHKNGEDWTLAHYARASRVFPLREVLLPHTAQKLVDDLHHYSCVGIPEVNVEALCYFALSIVWRAAQRPWTLDEVKIDQLELGPYYSEAFRQYLDFMEPRTFRQTLRSSRVCLRLRTCRSLRRCRRAETGETTAATSLASLV